jgi:hypothetical protein
MTVEIGGELLISLNDGITALNKHNKRREEIVTQVPFASAMLISAGSGTLDIGGQFEPSAGLIWSVRRLAASGFTAGTVNTLIDNIEPVAPFAQAGVSFFPPGGLLIEHGHRLVFSASGITGPVNIWGRADQFPYWYLSEYLD